MEKKFIFDAFDLAQEYFKDKKDLSGRPYMGHMERIAAAIEKERDKNCADKESSLFLYYDKAIAVAFLHDIIEDTDCTEEILYEKGFDKEIFRMHEDGIPVFGICGGLQMLGEKISDPYDTEGGGEIAGMAAYLL